MSSNPSFQIEIPERVNVATYFLDANIAQGRGENVAVYYENKTYTYNDMASLTNRVGRMLRQLDVEVENRVYLVLEDTPELVASFYGTIKIGGVSTLAYTYLKAEDYQYELDYIRPKVVITDLSALDRVRQAVKHSKSPLHLVVVGTRDMVLHDNEHSFWDLIHGADDTLEAEDTHKYDPFVWKFSGGTTGYRKAVPHCHADAIYAYESYRRIIQYTEDDIVLPIPKMFFGYGRDGTIVFPFRVGAAAVLYRERVATGKVFELISQHKPTIIVLVPTAIRRLLGTPKDERPDFSSIRLCTSAGEALPEELGRQWTKQFGCEIVDGIGSAEMYYVYLSNTPGHIVPGTLGKPAPGYDVRIVNEAGTPVPDGDVGILIAKGQSAGIEYFRDREKTRKTFRGEWVFTDDFFFKDKDGYFHFADRRDDLLKVSGYFVSPLEIEQCIMTHPDVAECAVIGVANEDGLEISKAFVVLKEGVEPCREKADQIQRFPKSSLSPYKYPRLIAFVKELPKTVLGKVDRRKLKEIEAP